MSVIYEKDVKKRSKRGRKILSFKVFFNEKLKQKYY